ncbi:hypothetical protein L3Q65_00830 (plasmid) [Amycolatopsis sp. FU40]|uniref:hypothetical protein n=1 Tax=Amycolatopsis sp. FU40 TaxID=2914159 RepID=UPI001F38FCC5|nr:hypothetical protein [Amycolatopsis sp. FU40]UKD50870.1 hypothetical protein L3Q65_00830 [Amycolatopsis sp. FU40]
MHHLASEPAGLPDWLLAALAAIALLALLLGAAGAVLWLHIRRAEQQSRTWHGDPYTPHSADARGRWTVSRLGHDLLEDDGFVLNTDPDPPPWRMPLPPRRPSDRNGHRR